MKRWRSLLAPGAAAFLLFALFTLPAQLVLRWFESAGVRVAGVSGTLWKGGAQVLTVKGVRIGGVQWNLHVLPLFTARLNADVKITRSDGFVQAEVTATPSGRLSFKDLSGSLPLSALPPNVIRGGWTGALHLKFAALAIENGWPVSADGTVEALNVTGPANKPVNIGSYQAAFPAHAAVTETLTGALTDSGGPLQVSGTLQLKAANRSYLLNGLIAARPEAPPDVVDTLQMLGPPDQQGRRPFGVEGTM